VTITLGVIRDCFEGAIPAVIATCASDGTPNVTLLSQVHYVDEHHVALSFQFFSKTRENILANPRAMVQVIHPDSGMHFYLSLQYLRTETEGPLFEYMKAKLAGVASHTGMSKVFRLRGSDVYRVLDIHCPTDTLPPSALRPHTQLPALRACSRTVGGHTDLAALLDDLLAGLRTHFDIRHAMVMMHDPEGARLYTVASCGYPESGVGSEVALGDGVIGVAAQERTPIRIGYMTSDYAYSRAVRHNLTNQAADGIETEIPFPGLSEPHSQMAVPISSGDRLFGVLYMESPEDMRFSHEDEDALVTLAGQLALAIQVTAQAGGDAPELRRATGQAAAPPSGTAIAVRRFPANDSVFIGDDYLIKGVAGAIFWKLVNDYAQNGRTEFSNRELRHDPALRLPDITDNLEARLILLQRRLAERCPFLRIEKTGRGRFHLRVDRPIALHDMAPDGTI
jgi:adenylate cyclase